VLPQSTIVRSGDSSLAVVPLNAIRDLATAVEHYVLRLKAAHDLSPDIHVFVSPGASFRLELGRRVFYALVNPSGEATMYHIWLATYEAVVSKENSKEKRFSFDLVDDPRTVVRCAMAKVTEPSETMCWREP
jgi:hypothetical protein